MDCVPYRCALLCDIYFSWMNKQPQNCIFSTYPSFGLSHETTHQWQEPQGKEGVIRACFYYFSRKRVSHFAVSDAEAGGNVSATSRTSITILKNSEVA